MKLKIITFLHAFLIPICMTAQNNLAQSHSLSPLEGQWLYVRVSEASTLFIEKAHKGKETTFTIQTHDNQPISFNETQGANQTQYNIKGVERKGDDIHITYEPAENNPTKTLLYPFRDVDNTWAVIHYYTNRSNQLYFAAPASVLEGIDYIDE